MQLTLLNFPLQIGLLLWLCMHRPVCTYTHASLYIKFIVHSHTQLIVSYENTGLGLIRSGLYFWLSSGDLQNCTLSKTPYFVTTQKHFKYQLVNVWKILNYHNNQILAIFFSAISTKSLTPSSGSSSAGCMRRLFFSIWNISSFEMYPSPFKS